MPIPGLGGLADVYLDWAMAAAVFLGVLLAVYLVGRLVFVPPLVRIVRLRNPKNETLVDATREYARLAFALLGIPIAITAAGYGNIVAGSAVVVAAMTLALGVAAQDVIGNFVCGVFLVSDPDFHIGDYIEWDDDHGTVEAIGYRVTRVRTPAGETITVPNATLATSTVHSPFARGKYRMEVPITVPMGDQAPAKAALADAASSDDRILDHPEPRVQLDEFDGDAAVLATHFWVDNPHKADLLDVKTDFGERAAEELADAGVAPPS